MCLSPIKITTRSHYISLLYQQSFIQFVSCGKCAECLSQKRNEWYFRIYHEWLNTYRHGGYVFFQTLTYDNSHLPMLSEMLPDYSFDDDHSCFSRVDLNLFFHSLRRKLSYHDKDVSRKLRYFVASEYGADDRYTHRPHYHVLFFVTSSKCSVFDLQKAVQQTWQNGRVDSLRLSGNKANYFPSVNSPNLGLSNYVAKYVQKSSSFQDTIEYRIDRALQSYIHDFTDVISPLRLSVDVDNIDLDNIYNRYFPAFLAKEGVRCKTDEDAMSLVRSYAFKQFRRKLVRTVDQFHLQSHGFGASALDNIDLDFVMEHGFLTMPDKRKVVKRIPLPKYYKQKLFYRLVKINGRKMFVLSDLGKVYRNKSEFRLFKSLCDKYSCYRSEGFLDDSVDVHDLARYVVYRRGRVLGNIAYFPTQDEVFNSSNILYNYTSPKDAAHFRSKILSYDRLHYDDVYLSRRCDYAITLEQFVKDNVFFDAYYEDVLHMISSLRYRRNQQLQLMFDYCSDYKNRLSI